MLSSMDDLQQRTFLRVLIVASDLLARAEVVWDLGWDPAPTTTNFETSLERLADLGDAGLPTVALLPDETHAADVWTADVRGLLLWAPLSPTV